MAGWGDLMILSTVAGRVTVTFSLMGSALTLEYLCKDSEYRVKRIIIPRHYVDFPIFDLELVRPGRIKDGLLLLTLQSVDIELALRIRSTHGIVHGRNVDLPIRHNW